MAVSYFVARVLGIPLTPQMIAMKRIIPKPKQRLLSNSYEKYDQIYLVQKNYFFAPLALTSPFSPMPRVTRQSGQYHFVVRGGGCSKPTHSI
jgi:hypothetical protein